MGAADLAAPSTARALRWFSHGRCLVEDEVSGETFLAARVVPGERVEIARVTRAGRRVAFALRVLEASPDRVAPSCPEYSRCSGCELLHVSPEEEQRLKLTAVAEMLLRHGGMRFDPVESVGSCERGGHRVRARVAIATSSQEAAVRVGFRGLDGAVVDIAACMVCSPGVERGVTAIRAWVQDHRPAVRDWVAAAGSVTQTGDMVAHVEIVEGTGGAIGAVFDAPAPALAGAENVFSAVAERVGREVRLRQGVWPDPIPVTSLALDAAPGVWTQPSPSRARELYEWVIGLGAHAGRRVLDATCGNGGLSLLLAREAVSVIGVDASWPAVQAADRAASRIGAPNAVFRGGKIQTVAPRMLANGESFELVVVNPMRVSIGDECIRQLGRLATEHVLYLGPAARAAVPDLRALIDAGWRLQRVAAVTLHPGTATVMLAALLAR